MMHLAKPCALLGGFGGMLPRENFLKWCNLVRFGVYLIDPINLSLKFFEKYHFLYKKIYILDKRLLLGITHGKKILNMLRLMHFGAYFERILKIKWLFSYRNNSSI